MDERSYSGDTSLPRSVIERIDEACDRFEAAWKAGPQPRIEDYLEESRQSERSALLRQLLFLDLDYRRRNSDTLTAEEYRLQLPEHVELIDSVFRETRVAAASGDTAARSASGTVSFADGLASAESFPKGKTFGRFELIELLGKGGFGLVYRARDPRLDRDVALKIPRAGVLTDERHVERFSREACAAAQLQHPYIVPVHETGRIEDTYYIASDFIVGKTLRQEIRCGDRITHRQAAALVAKLASALHYAHSKGIVHRDVKPENVMLDEQGDPHIMDFGLARREEAGSLLTQEGAQMGTPPYMSPEQAKGLSHQADARSDLWSVGVILYELLSGELPFPGRGTQVLMAILNNEPQLLRKLDKSIPRDLETICLKCLVKDPDRRYSSCQHLADELDRWRGGEAIRARPVGKIERCWRWAKRNPRTAGLSGAVIGLLIMVVVGFAIATARIADIEREAVEAGAVTPITQSFEMGLDAHDWSEEHLAKMEKLVADLRQFDPDVAVTARARLYRRFAEFIRTQIQQPRLEPDDVRRIEKSLALLASREAEEIPGLRQALKSRLSVWDPLFEISSPFLEVGKVFDPALVRVEQDTLVSRLPEDAESVLVRTVVSSRGSVQLEAVFDKSWKEVQEVGLQLHARPVEDKPQGYEFVLVRQLSAGKSKGPRDIRERAEQVAKGRLAKVLEGHSSDVRSLAFSPDGSTLASGSRDATIKLWDPKTGHEKATLKGHADAVDHLVFAADGKTLIAVDSGCTVRSWNPVSRQQEYSASPDLRLIGQIALSPDGKTLAAATGDGIVLWDLEQKTIRKTIPGHEGGTACLAFSGTGSLLASGGGSDMSVKIWDLASGSCRNVLTHEGAVTRVKCSADGWLLASSGSDKVVRLFDLEKGTQVGM